MHLIRRFHLPAFLCAFAVLLCELIAHPYTIMGVADDGPYILIAQKLAATGHIFYNGNTTPFLGWQLYLAAAFIHLFGFSFTTVRMSTLLVAAALAFVLQRTLVRAGISERNAAISTLALVLSPLYLMLSVTFMTDIFGLFAIVLCLYGCLRALQSTSARTTITWLCFAVLTNALFGSSRQIAWLGVLVMVPSTLYLLRDRRLVLLAGLAANLAGALFIFSCMIWFLHQPYNVHEPLLPATLPLAHTFVQLSDLFLEVPFLLLPLVALFLPQIRKSPFRVFVVIALLFAGCAFLASYPSHLRGHLPLEPTIAWQAGWVGVHGIPECISLRGKPPMFLDRAAQVLLTITSFGGLTGLLVVLLCSRKESSAAASATSLCWRQLGVLLAPFTLVYTLLLVPRATGRLFDRYLLPLLVVVLLCLVRFYQDRIHPRLPLPTLLLIAVMAIWSITVTHNTFSLYRARAALAAELRANGIPNTSVDNGWEYDFDVEIQHAGYIHDPRTLIPTHAYTPAPPLLSGTCHMFWRDRTPDFRPLYGISFQPTVCYGPAPFLPVHYSRWPATAPGTLYVVRYTPPSLRPSPGTAPRPLAILKPTHPSPIPGV